MKFKRNSLITNERRIDVLHNVISWDLWGYIYYEIEDEIERARRNLTRTIKMVAKEMVLTNEIQ